MSTTPERLHVAVVGLEFGADFAPIYADHPDVRRLTICDLDPGLRAVWGERIPGATVRASLDEVLEDPDVDAVHLVTGLDAHADQVVRSLEAGKHTACTVPMALDFGGIERILAAREASARTYMMMETAVFTRDFLWAEELVRSGALGDIGYARGTHFYKNNLNGYPQVPV